MIEKWGVEACDFIRENPFCLRIFPGAGFLKCDALYRALGLPMDAMTRQVNCVLYACESDITGSTWVPKSLIANAMSTQIGGVMPQLDEAIWQAVDENLIRQRDDGSFFAVAAMADAESSWVSDVSAAVKESIGDDGF